ncbi:MAG TPA: 4-(cytidine 5'-diphospho)-2-C-methyl-D-erythritol kinase [Panacibacter sp.]|nr:4-(cytidine 5'-diphospho)-2-C-methyl-D-erythritol kinase [Panacibacter sp.]
MVIFPNCKINLGLNIVNKRADGYHDIETIFYPLPFCDALEIITNPEHNSTATVQFSATGLKIDGAIENNLCVKAYNLLKKDFPLLPAIQMHLHKVIPMGAGLGGGSADGAFTLLLLNKKYQLNLSTAQLINYALQLGSDCPFFIINKPCFGKGRGEILEQIDLQLSAYKFVIVNPGIHINTAWAFSQITPAPPAQSLKENILRPVETWKNNLVNDFEKPVLQQYPQLQVIKDQLYNSGAAYAGMSGSGSTFFGIFKKTQTVITHFPPEYYVKEIPAL